MNIAGKKIWIIGAARSGLAAARLLHRHGANLFVTDSNQIEASTKEALTELKIPFEEGGHSIGKLLKEAQMVVLSPSVPLDKPLPKAVRQAGIPLVSEIEVASWYLPESAFVVGITGTNGKSTTTHYASQLFALGQRNSVACGNYGRAFSDALIDPAKFNAFVVELSSYQLETTLSFRPNVSILLNLQNDHQARYGTMEEYLKSKWRLVLLTRPDGLAIVDEAVLRKAIEIGLAMPECRIMVSYGFLDAAASSSVMDSLKRAEQKHNLWNFCTERTLPVPSYGGLSSLAFEMLSDSQFTHVWLSKLGTDEDSFRVNFAGRGPQENSLTLEISKPVLPGDHNQLNILAASLPAIHDGLHPNIVRAQWNQKSSVYQHLAHRLEEIGKGQSFRTSASKEISVRMINDSKATNVESTIVAIRSFKHGLRLLIGGEPKGDFYGEIIPYVGKNITKIYPFGKAAPLICQQLSGVADYVALPSDQMIRAAQSALDDARDGEIILLSPACASFDEFKNFEHRGDSFRHWAMQQMVNQ
jgi:UDP-N-acetylmuramoylalanine--D-glutamate ligase